MHLSPQAFVPAAQTHLPPTHCISALQSTPSQESETEAFKGPAFSTDGAQAETTAISATNTITCTFITTSHKKGIFKCWE
jgi:hypothetical protein